MTVDPGERYWSPDPAELPPLFEMTDHDEMTGALAWADEEERAERRRRVAELSALARVDWPRPPAHSDRITVAGWVRPDPWRGVTVPHWFVAGVLEEFAAGPVDPRFLLKGRRRR